MYSHGNTSHLKSSVYDLTCQYLINPIGLGNDTPVLSWKIKNSGFNIRQNAYQIQVASQKNKLISDDIDIWDTGKIISDESALIPYCGKPLASRQRYYWRVRIWDSNNTLTSWSEIAIWETGLLHKDDFYAKWISTPLHGDKSFGAVVPYLRKSFFLNKPHDFARFYVSALGIYDVYINGRRVSQNLFAPGWTNYNKKVRCQTYDVSDYLQYGENVIGVILGDGWYCGHIGGFGRENYGTKPYLWAQLESFDKTGKLTRVISDETWKWDESPIQHSDIIMGECYDATGEIPDWCNTDCSDENWKNVEVEPSYTIQLSPHAGPMVREISTIHPITATYCNSEEYGSVTVLDFGQNMVGRMRFKLSGNRGQKIIIRHAEILDETGRISVANLRSAKAEDTYIFKGTAFGETYEPHFTYHGFRYVEILGYDKFIDIASIEGIVIHSNLNATGSFECSDANINRLHKNILWSQRGNFFEIPTDCPQRDERLGWTGDAQIFMRTSAFNMNVAGFYNNWLETLFDEQKENGEIPDTAPDIMSRFDYGSVGNAAWADAAIICPWTNYVCNSDSQSLRKYYPQMQKYFTYLQNTSDDLIRRKCNYKDWLAFEDTPAEIIATAFMAHCADIMSRIAGVLNKSKDSEDYQKIFDDISKGFCEHFVFSGKLMHASQTTCVLALHFGLLPENMRQETAEILADKINANSGYLSTGFIGTAYLNFVLTKYGYKDIAYKLLFNEKCPSWLYSVLNGATTIWERWDSIVPGRSANENKMNSFNHYSLGAVGEWLYQNVLGIDTAADNNISGYKKIIIKPEFPSHGELEWARGCYESMYGTIKTEWRREKNNIELDVVIPPNTTADIFLPVSEIENIIIRNPISSQISFCKSADENLFCTVGSGNYLFECLTGRLEEKYV